MIGIGSSLRLPPQPPSSNRHRADSNRTHRRESSLSTNASTTSSQSRVLPFATASTRALRIAPPTTTGGGIAAMAAIAEHPISPLRACEKRESLPTITIDGAATATVSGQTYYPALGHPRFALAKPRRVITANSAIAGTSAMGLDGGTNYYDKSSSTSVRPAKERRKPGTAQRVRASISLHSMLPSATAEAKRQMAGSLASINGSASNSGSSNGNGSLGGTRTRPIIGLGVTLNPADVLVTLQPRGRNQKQPKQQEEEEGQRCAVQTKTPRLLSPVRSLFSSDCVETTRPTTHQNNSNSSSSPDASKHQSEALLDRAFKCVSFESLRSASSSSSTSLFGPINGDPKLVALSNSSSSNSNSSSSAAGRGGTERNAVAGSDSDYNYDLDDDDDDAEEKEESVPQSAQNDIHEEAKEKKEAAAVASAPKQASSLLSSQSSLSHQPVAVTCVLCFEHVLLSQKRSYTLRCPGCGNGLELPSDKKRNCLSDLQPPPAEPWSLPSSLSTLRPQDQQQCKHRQGLALLSSITY
ncbi:hypothetical protein IWW48_000590 [Coemansia sp. RSA 1200]|nr:hypothetical protein IWW48_000590 [Coemansia sp. RSA 1200]